MGESRLRLLLLLKDVFRLVLYLSNGRADRSFKEAAEDPSLPLGMSVGFFRHVLSHP